MAKSWLFGIVNQARVDISLAIYNNYVLSGDTIEIREKPRNGPPPKTIIVLSNITCPKLARRPNKANPNPTTEEPFAWEAREFLRHEIISKEVCFVLEKEVRPGTHYGVVCLGKAPSNRSIQAMMVEAGLAYVRTINNPDASKDEGYQHLLVLQKEAQSKGLFIWSPKRVYLERNIMWNIPEPASFIETYKGQPLDAIIDYVRDGSSMQLVLRPDLSKADFFVFMVSLTGVRAPAIKWKDGEVFYEPYAQEAQFFVESRLLNRDVTIILEGTNNLTVIASVLHPNGNIAQVLLREGLARSFDRTLLLLNPLAGTREDYISAENFAKTNRLRLWKDWEPPIEPEPESLPNVIVSQGISVGQTFIGQVVEIGNGDNITVKCPNGNVQKMFISSIRAPKFNPSDATYPTSNEAADENAKASNKTLLVGIRSRPLYDVPFMFEAREFLRKSLIGRKVEITVDYVQPKMIGSTFDDRICVSVRIGSTNIAEALVTKGLASVIRSRAGRGQETGSIGTEAPRAGTIETLLAAEAQAQKKHIGMYTAEVATPMRVIDLSSNLAKSKQFLPSLKRRGRLLAVVEFIISASRFRLYIPKENLLITLLLNGIECPRASRGSEAGDVFGDEALEFVRDLCMQRDVEIEIESVDRIGNFIGWLFILSQNNEEDMCKVSAAGKSKAKTNKKPASSSLPCGLTNTNLSVALVSKGLSTVHHAPFVERSVYYTELCRAEEGARKAKVGQWSLEDFTKSWEDSNNGASNNGHHEMEEQTIQNDELEGSISNGIKIEPKSGISKYSNRGRTGRPDYLDHLASLPINLETILKTETARNTQRKRVEVSAVVDPTPASLGLRFFVQTAADATEIERVSLELNKPAPGGITGSSIAEFTPRHGELCAANFSDDKRWYRARILKLMGAEALVQYIDFGNQERVPLQDKRLAKLPFGTERQSPFATEFRLAAIQLPPDRADQITALSTFSRMVQENRVYLMIEHAAVACGKDDVKPVQGVSLIWYTDQGPDGSNPAASSMDVAEELLRQGVVYMEPSMPHILSMPRHLIVRYSTTQKAAKDQRLNIWQYGDFREDLSG